MISPGFDYGKLKLGRFLIILLLSLVSLIPFNYLQFITFSVGNWRIPFYYLALGIPIFMLAIWALSEAKIFWKSGLILTLGILYVGMTMSLIQAINVQWTIRSIASFSLRGPLVTIVIVSLYHKIKDIKSTVKFMSIIGIIVASLGILEFVSNKNLLYHNIYVAHNPYYPQVLDINWRGGICGTVGHPLPLAAFLVLLLPLPLVTSFFSFNHYRQQSVIVLRIVTFLIVGTCIYLTFSRSSWISACLCTALFFLKKQHMAIFKKAKVILEIVGFVILTFSFIHIYLPQTHILLHNRFSLGTWRSEIFHSHRSASYKTVFNILKKYPLWGVGFGNYPKIHKKFVGEGASLEIETPDNQYLRWLADTGIVGFGCLVAFFALFFRKFAKAYRKCPDEELKTMMWAMFCGIIGFMVNLMAFDGFFWMAPNFVFWMMMGLLAAAMRLAERKTAVQ